MTVTDFKFERTITLGNILSAGTALSAIMAAYFTLAGRVDLQEERDVVLNSRIGVVEQSHSELSRAIVADRLANNTLLTQLQSDVRYMRGSIEEVKELLN